METEEEYRIKVYGLCGALEEIDSSILVAAHEIGNLSKSVSEVAIALGDIAEALRDKP